MRSAKAWCSCHQGKQNAGVIAIAGMLSVLNTSIRQGFNSSFTYTQRQQATGTSLPTFICCSVMHSSLRMMCSSKRAREGLQCPAFSSRPQSDLTEGERAAVPDARSEPGAAASCTSQPSLLSVSSVEHTPPSEGSVEALLPAVCFMAGLDKAAGCTAYLPMRGRPHKCASSAAVGSGQLRQSKRLPSRDAHD